VQQAVNVVRIVDATPSHYEILVDNLHIDTSLNLFAQAAVSGRYRDYFGSRLSIIVPTGGGKRSDRSSNKHFWLCAFALMPAPNSCIPGGN
jgi:hypothetical protein